MILLGKNFVQVMKLGCRLWMEGQKYFASGISGSCELGELEVFRKTRKWLEIYFSGKEPDFIPPLYLTGTPFQKSVWEIL